MTLMLLTLYSADCSVHRCTVPALKVAEAVFWSVQIHNNEGWIAFQLRARLCKSVRKADQGCVRVQAIDESPHQLRQAMASKGVLKGTVRLLHDQDRSTRLQVMDVLCLFAEVPALAPKIW